MDTVNIHYLKIRLNHHHILILLENVHIVLPIADLQAIPQQHAALAGILNFHGHALPVYHLSELINEPKPDYDLNTPLLVCTLSGQLIGLFVSEVIEVIELPHDMIQKQQERAAEPYVSGLVEEETLRAWVLDLESLCRELHIEKSHG